MLARFEDKFTPEPNSGCWLWTASLDRKGYGQFRFPDGRTGRAHRYAYESFVGPIPTGLEIDHLCRVRSCVNPTHLEPVTHLENIRRGKTGINLAAANLAKTHCPQGHPYSGTNLYVRPNGYRKCRECHRIGLRRYRKRNH